jgi:hypothetical protein
VPDDLSEYMTPAEFAGLSSDAHHAVWQAYGEGRIGSVPANRSASACTRLYNRAQVETILADLTSAKDAAHA